MLHHHHNYNHLLQALIEATERAEDSFLHSFFALPNPIVPHNLANRRVKLSCLNPIETHQRCCCPTQSQRVSVPMGQ